MKSIKLQGDPICLTRHFFYESGFSGSETLCDIYSAFAEKPLSRTTICRWLKKLQVRVTTDSIKLLQKTSIARSNTPLSSLIPENNTVLKQLKEFGYKKKRDILRFSISCPLLMNLQSCCSNRFS